MRTAEGSDPVDWRLFLACWKCKAEPGKPCVDTHWPSRGTLIHPHSGRQKVAK